MSWPLIIALLVAADFVLAIAILALFVKRSWSPIAQAHPPQSPATGAVGRDFQSFRFGVLNLGFSVHVKVDERFLHIVPARYLRWLGAAPMSLPWEAVTVVKRSAHGRWITADINGRRIQGPAWCLQLADDPDHRCETVS